MNFDIRCSILFELISIDQFRNFLFNDFNLFTDRISLTLIYKMINRVERLLTDLYKHRYLFVSIQGFESLRKIDRFEFQT